MVIYEYRCMNGEPIEQFFALGKAPDEISCAEHNMIARRQMSSGNWSAFPGSVRFDHRSS